MGHRLEQGDCRNTRLLLAVSGGADSMAMLYAALELREALGLELVVGTVDHGLRSEASAEAEQVCGFARSVGLTAEVGKLSLGESYRGRTRGSLQEWARLRRYELLGEMARQTGCRFLATAHTLDDQAETVVLRLLRGTGLEGLGGISLLRALDDRGDVCLIRPFLDVQRGEVELYLRSRGVAWIEDPSNRDPRFARVRVRADILPSLEALGPGIAGRLAALAEEARLVHGFIEDHIAMSDNLIIPIRLCGGVKVSKEGFASMPRPLWGHVFRSALRRVRGDLRRVERVHIDPILELVAQHKTTAELPMPGNAAVYLDQGDLYLFSGPLPDPPTGTGQPIPMGCGQWRLRFAALGAVAEVNCDRLEIAAELEVRARRPGDRVYGSSTKLKELFNKRKVPRPYRDYVPVLAYGDEILSAATIFPSRMEGVCVSWLLEPPSPVLDLGFGPPQKTENQPLPAVDG